ncbi:hypothetical protein C5167_038165 [Papaver somniferum]|uniref:Reticulon-like protein n=1 Tax=Papaver somniferum TaxID=3469 RepID=A0A4Y7IB02_PAPSO|nr:reticulon-like protein B13 isoform X2 [Papaver somniferum]RZC45216.1 hypothetical protein C5167_038165 [Papaver somniferum]
MSDSPPSLVSDSPPSPAPTPVSSSPKPGERSISNSSWEDILLWKKKKQSLSILTASTLTWVVLQVYQYNFITIASWVAMAILAMMFLFGNLLRLLGKDPPKIDDFAISEELVMGSAKRLKGNVEQGIRWMFSVSSEKEWFVFAQAIGALLVLSQVGRYFDFVTLLYMGVVTAMTVPLMYVKYEDQLKKFVGKIRAQGRAYYEKVDEKVLRKLKHKAGFAEKKKEKKVE